MYIAHTELNVALYRSNGLQSPTLDNYSSIEPGDTFEIPRTVNGFYYVVRKWGQDDEYPILTDAIEGVDYSKL